MDDKNFDSNTWQIVLEYHFLKYCYKCCYEITNMPFTYNSKIHANTPQHWCAYTQKFYYIQNTLVRLVVILRKFMYANAFTIFWAFIDFLSFPSLSNLPEFVGYSKPFSYNITTSFTILDVTLIIPRTSYKLNSIHLQCYFR